MTYADQTPACTVATTDVDRAAIMDYIAEAGRSRAAQQGYEFKEDDFIAGALATLQAIGLWNAVPTRWTLGLFVGESPLGLDTGKQRKAARLRQFAPQLLSATEALLRHVGAYRGGADRSAFEGDRLIAINPGVVENLYRAERRIAHDEWD